MEAGTEMKDGMSDIDRGAPMCTGHRQACLKQRWRCRVCRSDGKVEELKLKIQSPSCGECAASSFRFLAHF